MKFEIFSYCLSSRLLRCGCATGVPSDCNRVNTALADDYKICKVRVTETAVVPTPTVHPHGLTSISVVVPRFFNEPPFDTLQPSRLTLLADFATREPPLCEDHPSITAQKWGKNHCTLRVRLAMPGIDHKSDDHYYYDDQSPLETEFSMDMFEKAEYVRFFVQINVERHLKGKVCSIL
ncbi:unnamed protein product [Cylicostephanus goldi]|uniref:Uncharacterized protein n=1 Tax=Cylicostephanus goldi TaxID=71465 RepID=A0A3P7MU73_CYLGO|nr:unnamed protein product [Cylicostephanus goldi]